MNSSRVPLTSTIDVQEHGQVLADTEVMLHLLKHVKRAMEALSRPKKVYRHVHIT